jgi:hypothetical protein
LAKARECIVLADGGFQGNAQLVQRFISPRPDCLTQRSAGTGQGDDTAKLAESERERLRAQAREWLQLDIADWAKKVDQGTAADRIQAEKALSQWRENAELAALREPDALDRLSADERKECNALWSEVAALLSRARVAM